MKGSRIIKIFGQKKTVKRPSYNPQIKVNRRIPQDLSLNFQKEEDDSNYMPKGKFRVQDSSRQIRKSRLTNFF